MKSENLKAFEKLVSDDKSGWLDDANWNIENEAWLDKSAMIAIRILSEIRRQKPINGMTQKILAESMNVTPQYISKVVKGQENLTLQTIASIERVLGIDLVQIPSFTAVQQVESTDSMLPIASRKEASDIKTLFFNLGEEQDSFIESEEETLATGTYG